MDEEAATGYTWESEYEKTWEALQEDADGSLQASVDSIVMRAKRRQLLARPINVRLGMMRHMFLVIDMSSPMQDQDLKPTRLAVTLKLLEYFIEEYFDQNPISQLGLIITRNKRAEKITELGGNPKRHIACLKALKTKPCEGEPSLQNSLEMAQSSLRNMPSHASREVLVVFSSLTTCDPGDILHTTETLLANKIRCSIIGLAAEVRVCKKLCNDTHGTYNVILEESHYRDLLTQHLAPPPAEANTEASLIRMGFPHHKVRHDGADCDDMPSLCMCHLDSADQAGPGLSTLGYYCPQCKSKYCELPIECKVCGLTLVSAPHLARSYHHLFPMDPYSELQTEQVLTDNRFCYACQKNITEPAMYVCGKCKKRFCCDCDVFVHETLHTCPGCAASRRTQQVDVQLDDIELVQGPDLVDLT